MKLSGNDAILNQKVVHNTEYRRKAPVVLLILGALVLVAGGPMSKKAAPTLSIGPDSVFRILEEPGYRDSLRLGRILPTLGGELVVINQYYDRLMILAKDGKLEASVGLATEKGQEYRTRGAVFGAATARDTILIGFGGDPVPTPGLLLLLNGKGEQLATINLPSPEGGYQYEGLYAGLSGWFLLVRKYHGPSTFDLYSRPITSVASLNPRSGLIGDTVFRSEAPTEWYRTPSGMLYPVEAMRLRISVSGSAGIVVASSREYELKFPGAIGTDPPLVRIASEPVPITERYRRMAIEQLAKDSTSDSARKILQRLPLPAARPVVGGLWSAPDGRLAVLRHDLMPPPWLSMDSVTVDLLTAKGDREGAVRIPANHTIRAFLGDAFITSWPDTSANTRKKLSENPRYQPPVRLSRLRVVKG